MSKFIAIDYDDLVMRRSSLWVMGVFFGLMPVLVSSACRLGSLDAQGYVMTTGGASTSKGESGTVAASSGIDGMTSEGPVGNCGDGILAVGEECDDAGESAMCNDDCTMAVCGDDIANLMAGEQCDGADLVGASCVSQGYAGGVLACNDECTLDPMPCSILSFSPIKRFDFAWPPRAGTDNYRIFESRAPGEPLVLLGDEILGDSVSYTMPLHLRQEARYELEACVGGVCDLWRTAEVGSSISDAVGYFKASNTDQDDRFGVDVALSGDGDTLVVGADYEASDATNIDGDQSSDALPFAGAVYVFAREQQGGWSQQAYIKASNTGDDGFGDSIALSSDGDTLAVAAHNEDGGSANVGGGQNNDDAVNSGAVYIYTRNERDEWSPPAYIKTSNPGVNDGQSGFNVALSGDGDILAVGVPEEDSDADEIDGDRADNTAMQAGAVYVYVRDGEGWSPQAYIKASNSEAGDYFGSVSLNGNGDVLAVGAFGEDSSGDPFDNGSMNSGAVYMYGRDELGQWSQTDYLKSPSISSEERIGRKVMLSRDGAILVVVSQNPGPVYVYSLDPMAGWMFEDAVVGGDLGQDAALSGDGTYLAVSKDESVYLYHQNEVGEWLQRAYVEAPNVEIDDCMVWGCSLSLADDGGVLAVGAKFEGSQAIDIDGDQLDNSAVRSGAVYLY